MPCPEKVYARWRLNLGDVLFSTCVSFGSEEHLITIAATAGEIAQAAKVLRERPDCEVHAYQGCIRRPGKRRQHVPVHIPRETMLGIADALSGAVDDEDAAHRFYHWEHPDTPRPCGGCRETRDTEVKK